MITGNTDFQTYRAFLILAFLVGMTSCRQEAPGALPGFEIHPDFYMELVAREPLVLDPVEMHFDEAGRAYVLEMPGYPLRDAQSRLVRLEDRDRDGIYDHREVFSDSLGVASSFMPYRKGFLVACPPELIWISDTDGDGREDARKVVLQGFSNDNLQHNFNGLTYALNNRIYIANGGNSGAPAFPGHPDSEVPLRGGDLSLRSDLGQMWRVGESSGGFKLTFDSWGHLFETHNLEHNLHLVMEDRYLEGVPGSPDHALINISDHETDGLSRVYPIGEQETRVNHPEQSGYFSGSCGITYYGADLFPETFRNGLFVADVVLNLVHFDHLREAASSFETSRYGSNTEFLASSYRAFRPVNFTVGPDGSLFVIDMHRDVIEHPEWIPDELEKDLDLLAGQQQGRIYRIRPKIPAAASRTWDFSSADGLNAALGHPNQWVRQTAQRLLVTEDRESSVRGLMELIQNGREPVHRLHALWTLEGLGQLPENILLEALQDPFPGVRENALKIAERHVGTHREILEAVLARCEDEHPRVRLRAVLALTGVHGPAEADSHLVIARAITGILERGERDQWMLRAASAALLPQATQYLKGHVARWRETESWGNVLRNLTEVMGSSASVSEITELLEEMNAHGLDAAVPEALKALAAGWIARDGAKKEVSARTVALLEQALGALETGNDRPTVYAAAGLRRALGIPASSALLRMLAHSREYISDTARSAGERLEWLQLAGLGPFENRAGLLEMLLDSRVPMDLQREALRQLWDSDRAEVPAILLGAWEKLGPEARRHATDILVYKQAYHSHLLQAMEEQRVQLGEFNLDLERRRVFLFSEDPSIRQRAEKLFSDSGIMQRTEALEAFRPALSGMGDPNHGRELFLGRCASCHRMGAIGTDVGPVLTEIGRKSKETLLHDILDPNAAADTRYLSHTVVDDTGTMHVGVVLKETDREVGLQLMGGEQRIFRKDRIRSFTSSGRSLMPEGLEAGMTPADMSDLLAFLQELR